MSDVSRELIQASASSKIPAATPLRRLKRDKATEWTVPQQGDRNEYPHAAAAEGNVELSEDASDEAAVALPDGGRTAWMQVAASFLINLNVYGAVNAFGVFQNFYETEQLTSYSSSTISWIGTLQGSLILFIGAVAGPLFDKGYFMLTLRGAAIGLVFSWMMLSLSTQYYQIMLTQGILAGICTGLMEVPSIAIVADYFQRRLGLALGIAISGAPVGGLVYSAVFQAVLTATNFGWATRVIGFITLATLAIAILIVKPKDASRKAKSRNFLDFSAFKEGPFVCMVLDAFFAYCAALVPYFITPQFALAIGTTKNTANYLITVLNAAQLVGRFVPAWLSDFYGGADMLLFAQVLIGILGLHWITIATLGGLVEWLIFVGIFSGMVATLPAVTIPFISPNPDTLGTRIGFIYGAAGLGALVGNPIAFAATGNTSVRHGFLGAQLWMGLCGLLGAAWFIVPGRSAKRNRKAMLG